MRKIASFALALCICISVFSGCGEVKEPDDWDKVIATTHLTIGYITGTYSGSYALSTDAPKDKIGDIEFFTWKTKADPGIVYYSPKRELSFSDFGAILAVFTVKYGQPTYSEKYTYRYEWLSEDEKFSLRISYDEKIFNHFAMCVKNS